MILAPAILCTTLIIEVLEKPCNTQITACNVNDCFSSTKMNITDPIS